MKQEALLLELQAINLKLHRCLAQEWGKHVEQGISSSQSTILDQLNSRGKLRASDLAEVLNVTSGAVTGLCDKLIKCGFACRSKTEEDRRVVYLEITEQGKVMLESVLRKRKEITEKFYSWLSDEDIEHLIRINYLVMHNIERQREG